MPFYNSQLTVLRAVHGPNVIVFSRPVEKICSTRAELTRSGFILRFELPTAQTILVRSTLANHTSVTSAPWQKKNVEAECRGTEGIKDQGRIDLRNAGGHRDLGKTREKIRKALKHDDNI